VNPVLMKNEVALHNFGETAEIGIDDVRYSQINDEGPSDEVVL
jgi:hypothetical protein